MLSVMEQEGVGGKGTGQVVNELRVKIGTEEFIRF